MFRTARRAVAGAVLAGLLLAGPAPADDTKLKVKVGDPFPTDAVPATQAGLVKKDAKELSITDLKGKVVVVAFYPKALTGGWTLECNGFRDLLKEFPADAVVLGASADSIDLNQKFTDTNKYTFPLLCDTDLKLIKALGILGAPNGKTAKRVTFVVDRDGKIAHIFEKVAPKDHADEVLKVVRPLVEKK